MRKLLILAVLICGSVYMFAGPTEFTFIGWDQGNWQNGYPYYIMPTGGSPTIFDVMCDDYVHGGEPGQRWDANITDLGTGNIMLTRFNTTPEPDSDIDLMHYNEAGWLLLETKLEPMSQWMYMNDAVWTIFDPSAPCNTACAGWMAAAAASIKGLPQSYFDDVYIITPVNQHDQDPNSMQEFLYLGEGDSSPSQNQQSTPEPGTLVLMGTGLLGIIGRRRFLN
ncbi:MAG: PEP-CTERM sorting domain-containing protein [Candidatus Korobacteraceae bacterium]